MRIGTIRRKSGLAHAKTFRGCASKPGTLGRGELVQAAGELIPDRLVLNGVLPKGDTRSVPFHLTAERSALARPC